MYVNRRQSDSAFVANKTAPYSYTLLLNKAKFYPDKQSAEYDRLPGEFTQPLNTAIQTAF